MEKGKEQILLPKARNLSKTGWVFPYCLVSCIYTGVGEVSGSPHLLQPRFFV